MGEEITVWLDVTIRHATDAAVLVYDGQREAWVPRSLILDVEDDLEVGVETRIEVGEWVALAKGLV